MMRERVRAICERLPATTMDHPFGDDHDAYKVGGKMYAIVGGMGDLSFKVSEIAYEVLTGEGRARPAPYLARAKWVQIGEGDGWDEQELADHLAQAHRIIAGKLTRKARAELGLA
jgi:predicted DNA-binding protein (MmcQ/YjbR family)